MFGIRLAYLMIMNYHYYFKHWCLPFKNCCLRLIHDQFAAVSRYQTNQSFHLRNAEPHNQQENRT